jgi:hypothetical protein
LARGSIFTLGTEARRRSTVAASLLGAHTHHTVVNGSFDGVVLFVVHLGKHVVLVERSIADVTHSGRLNDVSDYKAFHCLVLGDVLSREHADNALHVSAVLPALF